MNVAFLNENTLGHTSYLPRFVEALRGRPELGIVPRVIDVLPLPQALDRRANFTVRGLRKIGLDFHLARWRRVVSRHARERLDVLRSKEKIDAVVVNTQSAGLFLIDPPLGLPIHVGLDATFRQLANSGWFAMNRVAGWLNPVTLAPILGRERRLFASASGFFPWSASVGDSLVGDYGVDATRVTVLPPSLELARMRRRSRTPNARPQILFLGGDFVRKGGRLLLDAFRRRFASRAELHVVTQSEVGREAGVSIHRGVKAGSDAWYERWSQADLFVFPSALETFGIVLIEALAFEVPVVSSRVGAAVEILEEGRLGVLISELTEEALSDGIRRVLEDPAGARERSRLGRERVERDYDLERNTVRLVARLREGLPTG